MRQEVSKAAVDKALELLEDFEKGNTKLPVKIYYKGISLRLPSGKQAWADVRSAKVALSNALYHVRYANDDVYKAHRNGELNITNLLLEKGLIEIK